MSWEVQIRGQVSLPAGEAAQDNSRMRILVLIQPRMLRGISWHVEDLRTNVLSRVPLPPQKCVWPLT